MSDDDQREELYAIQQARDEHVRLHDGRLLEIINDTDNFYRPEIKSMARELLELRATISAMTPPSPWSERK